MTPQIWLNVLLHAYWPLSKVRYAYCDYQGLLMEASPGATHGRRMYTVMAVQAMLRGGL